ncbi:Hypothetical protein, putative [Bodo saltans]|uniref:Uncharacterized protein n=1 Tax=Bodo saltans TaxID=75058 RepID=A0A0S4INZ2_BODSA|nr:Hypothetical protein, putative [Bodo saltans]|eukprot:CUE95611.1 Hypothetical protein, putative [Bodo saltans]
MTQVFDFVKHEGQVVHANRVRDATRRYIISARLGSPERPRHTGHRNGGSSATLSHDF